MKIEERPGRLDWEGSLNARDLGGYPTRDGHSTAWGAVVRSDTPSELSERGRQALIDSGVRSIIDLRLPAEVRSHPNPFAETGPHGIQYTHISFFDPVAQRPARPETLTEEYIQMMEVYRPAIAAIMTAIAESPDGAVLVHCMGGKDRTGLISALLLDLAGVPRETVANDYALTSEYLRPLDETYLEKGPGVRADREAELARNIPKAEVMLGVLDHLEEQYGGVEEYLLHSGVAAKNIDKLRRRLVPEG